MATKDQILEWEEAGEAIHRERERDYRGERSAGEVKALREQSAKTASHCGDCLAPLSPDASVTRVARYPDGNVPRLRYNRIDYKQCLSVPICLHCWLIDIADPSQNAFATGVLNLNRASPLHEWSGKEIRRLRCEFCARPMRVETRQYRSRLPLPERCCCTECHYKATLKRANERRRVRHQEQPCIMCGEMFTPRQSTAKTCGNTCRQRLSRQRRAADRTEVQGRSSRHS